MAIKSPQKMYRKNCIWERWVVSTIVLSKSALRKHSRHYWKTTSNIKWQHAPTQTDNQTQKYVKNSHFLLQILAVNVIGRYGHHLMTVTVWVWCYLWPNWTTFKTVQEFPIVSLDFTLWLFSFLMCCTNFQRWLVCRLRLTSYSV